MAERQRSGGDGDGDTDPPNTKCAMWMSKKRRFCASPALPTSAYCGNHRPCTGEIRVPCPVDPSHTILEEDVASHVKKCSATKQLQHSELQSYFCQGVNAGSDEEDPFLTSPQLRDPNAPVDTSAQEDQYRSCGAKRAAIAGISDDQFREFVKRIESAHEECSLGTEDESFLHPPQCSKWWDPERDRRWPFQEKHVSQQASLLGNLEAFGLLQSESGKPDGNGGNPQDEKKNWVYVEFGAGRGYLGHMLCDSYGVSSLVLVERKAYKFKADRTLRQILGVSVERLRTDKTFYGDLMWTPLSPVEDLDIQGVESLCGRHFVAVSKHLCGPATDLTLRCCLKRGRGTSFKPLDPRCCYSEPILEGIGIATCCHHLCQWRSYVNKPFFRKLGFSMSDFNMITWLTSWAVNQIGEHGPPEIEASTDQNPNRQGDLGVSDHAVPAKPQVTEAMNALDPAERAVLGRRCKDLIDHGRLLWLQQCGLDVKMVKYISPSVTPENKLLLARKGQVAGGLKESKAAL